MDKKISKRVSLAIINSLSSGVVPRVGIEHIAVGRKQEIECIIKDLEAIEQGASCMRFISGRYGSGKSFMLQIIRNYAMDKNFVVSDVDLSPEKRLCGTKRQGIATYRELMERLSTKLRPDGGALEGLIQKWINTVKNQVIENEGKLPEDEDFNYLVERNIYKITKEIETFAHGYDFAYVISSYYNAYVNDNDELKQAAIRWIRGEYANKSEAKKYLKVSEIITDENWYDYIKLLALFFSTIGYSGFLVMIDECVNLYKISNRISRESNYEKLLSMFNDTMQGKAKSLGFYLGATPQLVEDERRGFYSYEALRSRLVKSRFTIQDCIDMSNPIIPLRKLDTKELIVLLEKIVKIHEVHYGYQSNIQIDKIVNFLNISMERLGAGELETPREILRDFISCLNMLYQNSEMTIEEVMEGNVKTHKQEIYHKNPGKYAEFEI
ncbi:MAG: ATP-binding protein [Lachnospiraceae bacterium]|nr:ATP-binding protein [Lachnospiraceae bacterium]